MTPADIATAAATLWGEARGEGPEGLRAVWHVIQNRAAARKQTIEAVCRAPKQFSCWNANDPNRAGCEVVERAVREVLTISADPTDGAKHYCTTDSAPAWAAGLTACVTIGRHKFFNNVP